MPNILLCRGVILGWKLSFCGMFQTVDISEISSFAISGGVCDCLAAAMNGFDDGFGILMLCRKDPNRGALGGASDVLTTPFDNRTAFGASCGWVDLPVKPNVSLLSLGGKTAFALGAADVTGASLIAALDRPVAEASLLLDGDEA